MTSQFAPHTAEDYARATEEAFLRCPAYSGLRLTSTEVRHGYLNVRFEGPVGDFRGPYGVRVVLPAAEETLPTGPAGPDPLGEWIQAVVMRRALEAHAQSVDQERGYTTDDVWWLVDDSVPGQESVGDQPAN